MNRLLKNLLVVLGVLLSSETFAHPGHGTFSGHELWHYLTSPAHIGIGLGSLAVLVLAYKAFKTYARPSDKE